MLFTIFRKSTMLDLQTTYDLVWAITKSEENVLMDTKSSAYAKAQLMLIYTKLCFTRGDTMDSNTPTNTDFQ